MPQPLGSFSSLRIGQGLRMSKNLKKKKPSNPATKMFLIVAAAMNKNVTAWPENSSATISEGSVLFVAAIIAGANFIQIAEPIKAKTAIITDIAKDENSK